MDTPTEQQKKKGGRPQSEVWRHYEKKPLKSAGHFSAKCNYCRTYWPRGHPNELEDHLANNCREVPELVHSFYLGVVSARDFGREDTFSSPENSKKRKTQVDQRELTDWFESTNINSQKKASITRALVRAFICCGIPFSIIENPFFIEFLHEMRPGYEPPTSELLSGRLLNQETARINDKIKEIIKNSENLTLALDGWTNPNGVSVYNYVILTPDREQYLYALHDYSGDHHTGDFLAAKLRILSKKLALKKEIVTNQFPNIIDLRCIAHFVNLVTKQIMEHDLAKITISGCNQITSFFKRSHIVGKLLTDATTTLQIVGGGLKTYCETRWTSMYEAVSSVSRLRMALEHVLKNNPNEITNKSVRRNIRSSEFFSNVDKLTKVLKPIKTAITLLESANANLADCFLQLILIANTIKKLPSRGMGEFHQHCIESFNKYWDKFDPKIYILAYFLHPAYRGYTWLKAVYWKTITTTAAQIWQNNGGDRRSCNRLLAQMRNYELRKSPYNQEFDSHLETPMSWWLTIKDKYDYLPALAIMVFSITPHSAGCERIFSTLGWLYGTRRQRLGLLKVEAMAKIRSFYVSNIKNELAYVSQQYTEDEVHEMINDSTFLQFEEEEDEIDNRRNIPISEIPNHEVRVLIIEEMFNLKNAVKCLNNDGENSDDSDINDDVNETDGKDELDDSDENVEMESNYDVEELIQQYSIDNELEGDTL
ncbi:ribonuclease H-like domain-containing protein [Rhizophagus irregularis DAOM 181602=DAOM 197198]|nr:ribonuclease H-like domain-containing protein [Rhizophagus irregularis DAOM 181602=DAOM 197198]